MIDIEERRLRAFKQHALIRIQRIVQQVHRVAEVRQERKGIWAQEKAPYGLLTPEG